MSRFDGCRSLTTWPPIRISPELIELEARDRVEQSRLAAAGRADQHEKAALLERDVDALEDFQAAEPLAERTDFESGHWLYPFTAPAIRPRTK